MKSQPTFVKAEQFPLPGTNPETALVPANQALTAIPGGNEQMGAQVTDQYHRATEGMRAVVRLGTMLLVIQHELKTVSTRGHGGKFGDKGTGLEAWLKEYAPEVPHGTAYRFMTVARAVQEQFKALSPAAAAKVGGFEKFVLTPAEQLPEKLRPKQLELWSFVDGTSQRSWLDKLKARKPLGGAREHGDKSAIPTSEEMILANSETIWKTLTGQLFEEGCEKKSFAPLGNELLEHIDGVLMEVRKNIRAALKNVTE